MMNLKLRIKSLDDLERVGADFIAAVGENRIFALYGWMGAGKTTLVKALCRVLGATDVVTSPTFTLVNEYSSDNRGMIYHFDFYRIEKITEAYDFGFEEYLWSGSFCFIEWPEKVEELLPPETVKVNITVNDDMSRSVEPA